MTLKMTSQVTCFGSHLKIFLEMQIDQREGTENLVRLGLKAHGLWAKTEGVHHPLHWRARKLIDPYRKLEINHAIKLMS